MDTVAEGMCKFCTANKKKYTCPRCHADYCSITCFQSSSHIECAESFYQECVLENLSREANDTESRQKLNDMLQRLHEHENYDANDNESIDSDDDSECESLSKRLENVDLDDTKEVWKRLTNDERQEFEAFLRSGDVSKLVPKWAPWWSYDSNIKIQEIDEVPKHKLKSPKILEDIIEFSALTSKAPSACVQYNVVNIICAYVFTCRYFNGDYLDFIGEAVGCIIYLSLYFKENKNYNNFNEAVNSVEEECLKNDWISVDQENLDTMKEDVEIILKGVVSDKNYYILSALSDLYRLISSLLKEDTKGNTFLQNCPKYKLSKKDLKLYLRKLEYLLSYTMHYDKNKASV